AAEGVAARRRQRHRERTEGRHRGRVPRRSGAGMARALAREPEGARARAGERRRRVMDSILGSLALALVSGRIRVVDLTQTLSPEFPQIALPPEMGQCWAFRVEEISHYDERGPGWYWNNFSCGEHTGTHFDAPVHWVTGKDHPQNTTDSIPAQKFIAPACVIDVSREAAGNPDFLLTLEHIAAWEQKHGRI